MLKSLIVFIAPILICTSCSVVRSSYTQLAVIETASKKSCDQVEYISAKPTRAALKIAEVSSAGNQYSSYDDLIKDTKKKAAELGADFILAERSGIDTETVYSPGYSSYQSNAESRYGAGYNKNFGSANGSAKDSTIAYSVGPSITKLQRPWSVFSIWIYTPSNLGIRLDDDNRIIGFHLNSDAENIGIKVGDQLLGIDDYDVLDQSFTKHLMRIYPGDKIKVTVRSNMKRKDYIITALPN